MPVNITCADCSTKLLAFESLGPTPIGRDDCPRCSGTEFAFLS